MILLRLSILLPLLAACAMGGNKPQGRLPRPEEVKNVVLTVTSEAGAPRFDREETERLQTAIAANLASWGYPIHAPQREATEKPTHRLEARVGPVARKSTPPGLSFTLGDSDVRAPEFQKADVQNISCLLSDWNAPGEGVKLSGDFAVEKGFGELLGGKAERESTAFYVDRVGTVCLNLLSELKIARPKAKAAETGGTVVPAWAPEVRIEVRNKPQPGAPAAAEKPPAPQAGPNAPESPAAEPAKPQEEQDKAQDSAIQTETKETGEDSRKQIIIHNRGAPVILEFGYERK